MHSSGPRFCIPCMAGLRSPAFVVKMCFSGPSGQSPLWEGFVVSNQYRCTFLICDVQCRQYNQPVTTRWCMMHLTTGGFPIRREECDEACYICGVPLEMLLRHGHLSVFSIRSTLDVARWRKCSASYAPGASSTSTKHYTTTSVPLIRVGYCLFCAHICPCCLILSYNMV